MMIITKIVMVVKILTNLTKIIYSQILFFLYTNIKHIYKYRAFIDPFFHLNDMVVHTLVTWITSEKVCQTTYVT